MFCKAVRNMLIINEVTICKQRAKYQRPESVIQVYYKHREARRNNKLQDMHSYSFTPYSFPPKT